MHLEGVGRLGERPRCLSAREGRASIKFTNKTRSACGRRCCTDHSVMKGYHGRVITYRRRVQRLRHAEGRLTTASWVVRGRGEFLGAERLMDVSPDS